MDDRHFGYITKSTPKINLIKNLIIDLVCYLKFNKLFKYYFKFIYF
jgi:hypothetical protein